MITIQKGNLYNHLKGRIDATLLDSNQYDLNLVVDGVSTFYRVFFNGEFFQSEEISEPKTFLLPKYSKPAHIDELTSFYNTMYYGTLFPYRKIFDSIIKKSSDGVDDYFAYLKKVTGKNLLSSETIYDFMMPAYKNGVQAYEISIELIKKRYYVVFVKEHVSKGYFQSNCTLYSIFVKNDFEREKNKLEEAVLEFCLQYDYPITLATFLLVICNQDLELLKEVMDIFILARNKKDCNILLTNKIYSIIAPSLQYDNELEEEIRNYINQKEDDIHYQFKKQKKRE